VEAAEAVEANPEIRHKIRLPLTGLVKKSVTFASLNRFCFEGNDSK
jgi:hypothetical protein